MSVHVGGRHGGWSVGVFVLAVTAVALLAPATAGAGPGAVLWEKTWVPGTGYLADIHVAVAPNGNVFVGGLLNNGGYGKVFAVTCYKPGGRVLWSRSAMLTATTCGLSAMAADGRSGVVLTGYANSFDGPVSWVTCRWSAAGVLKYQQGLNVAGARAYDVVCDGVGNAYVVGTVGATRVAAPFADWCIVKYDPTGAAVWTRVFNGAAGLADLGTDIARDADGRIYVAGTSWATAMRKTAVLLKYTATGKRLWKRSWGGPADANGIDVSDVAATRDGAAPCGSVWDHTGRAHPFVLRYTPAGKLAWARTYRYATTNEGSFDAVSVDRSGQVVVAGRQNIVNPADWDMLVARYRVGGGLAWTRLRSFADSTENVGSLALDAYGDVFIAGGSGYPPNGPEPDCITWSLKPSGASRWFRVRSHTGFASGRDVAVTATAAYVAGDQGDGGWFLIKYVR
jgi:hypothetical protein